MITKDTNGFITESESKSQLVLGLIITTLTFFLPYLIAYEFFFERYYWKNRFRLWKLLKQNQLKIDSKRTLNISPNIDEYIVDINGVKYDLWVYNDNKTFVFCMPTRPYVEYIGLFISSPIMKYYTRKIINRVKQIETNG
jgi:hypothetical protein